MTPSRYVCIECGKIFTDRLSAAAHQFNPPTKKGPGTPRVRHNVFPQSPTPGREIPCASGN
jgi:hypothetical protein